LGIREERLYYADSYLWEFQGMVVDARQDGEKWHVRLDQSAFYPTSGGQPHDTGTLNDVPVVDVFIEDGAVFHTVTKPLSIGEKVVGHIDAKRRLDFMQQHCGQHILSRCFEDLMDVETVGFHLGAEWVTIDLNVQRLSWADIERAEWRANEVVWENRPVSARFVTPEELVHFSLRRPPKVTEDIRIVSIEGFDDNACGGTHPSATGAVGAIKVVKSESMRGGVRLTFVCGARALADFQKKTSVLREVGQALSTGVDELLPTVQKLQSNAVRAQKQIDEAKEAVAEATARELIAKAAVLDNGTHVVVHALHGSADFADLKRLGAKICQAFGDGVPACIAVVGEAGERLMVQLLSSAPSLPANEWFKASVAPLGGKGGGNRQAAQGSVALSAEVTVDRVLHRLHTTLTQEIPGL
jgi:alanyl-tRNA synthetase